jgi:dTDP-4-dehydrorhamnose reductase
MRNVLIVGAAGQVGRALLSAQWPDDVRVHGADRQALDITSLDRVTTSIEACRWDVVVNAAAYTNVDLAESESAAAWRINHLGAANLAEVCARNRAALIHLSTDYVFDGRKHGHYLEGDRANPLNVYGASKLAGEKAIRARLAQHIILRTSWVFGIHGHNFVKTMLRVGSETALVHVVDDQVGGPTAAADIAQAVVNITQRVLNDAVVPYGTYHYSGRPSTNWFGFAREIFAGAAARKQQIPTLIPIATSEYPRPAQRPPNSVLDCGGIRGAFSIEQPDWRCGLARVLDVLCGSPADQSSSN